MESTTAAQCFVEEETGLVLDMVGNKLPTGSVLMCKLTPFVIKESGDINYVGGGKMETVYWADDKYFEVLDQQVKELHMERGQGFITSVFRALTGGRHKTQRKQLSGIPPTWHTTTGTTSGITDKQTASYKIVGGNWPNDQHGHSVSS